MSVSRDVSLFIEGLASLRFQDVFNPYVDRYVPFDVEDAPAIRRENLRHVMEAAAAGDVDELWVGLELGHKGGRRTGLAMTDDANLVAHGHRFGVGDRMRHPTQAGPPKELTAGAVWELLADIDRSVFLWNVVPLHPHTPGDPLSNRRHTREERAGCRPTLEALINLLAPKRLVAIGRDASTALRQYGYAHAAVRHPAFGGRTQFLRQMRALPET